MPKEKRPSIRKILAWPMPEERPGLLAKEIILARNNQAKSLWFKGESDWRWTALEDLMLQACLTHGHSNTVRHLLRCGMPPSVLTDRWPKGWGLKIDHPAPIFAAAIPGARYTRITRLLLETGQVPVEEMLLAATHTFDHRRFKLLLADGRMAQEYRNPFHQRGYGYRMLPFLLHRMVACGRPKVAQLLFDAGWRVNDWGKDPRDNVVIVMAKRILLAKPGSRVAEINLAMCRWLGERGSRADLWSKSGEVEELASLANQRADLSDTLRPILG